MPLLLFAIMIWALFVFVSSYPSENGGAVLPSDAGDKGTYEALADAAAGRWNVEPAFLRAIIQVESGWDPNAVASTGGDAELGGAYGLGQMTLETAKTLRPDVSSGQLMDPVYNVDICAEYISRIRNDYGADIDVASVYNSGKPFFTAPLSTKTLYVPKVMAALALYRKG